MTLLSQFIALYVLSIYLSLKNGFYKTNFDFLIDIKRDTRDFNVSNEYIIILI